MPESANHPVNAVADRAWRELGETPTTHTRRLLDDDDARWQILCTRSGINYYLREWVAYDNDGYEHLRVEVGSLGPVKWSEQT